MLRLWGHSLDAATSAEPVKRREKECFRRGSNLGPLGLVGAVYGAQLGLGFNLLVLTYHKYKVAPQAPER